MKDVGGLIEPDIIDTLGSMNVEYRIKEIHPRTEEGHQGESIDLKELSREIRDFRPHFILSVNTTGCDRSGVLTGLYSDLKIPLACWFVDQPAYDETWIPRFDPENSLIFMIDRDYAEAAVSGGIKNVYHLPLGTNCRRFTPDRDILSATEDSHSISFVGRLMARRIQMILSTVLKKMPDIRESLVRIMDQAAGLYIDDFRAGAENALKKAIRLADSGNSFNESGVRKLILSFIDFAASMKYRRDIISALSGYDLKVYGDREWDQILPAECVSGPMNDSTDISFPYYGKEIVDIYRNSKINLNITKFQLKTAINQRVFDVPACGGFLLTDYREDLDYRFETGKEIVFYTGMEDLKDKVSYYLNNPLERQRIAKAGMNRVRAEHDFSHRLDFILSKAHEHFYE